MCIRDSSCAVRRQPRPGSGVPPQVSEAPREPAGSSVVRRTLNRVADPSTYRPRPGEIPTDPGVYRFRDGHGRVIYVGKAKSLRQRLSSYFQDVSGLHPRTQTMVRTCLLYTSRCV